MLAIQEQSRILPPLTLFIEDEYLKRQAIAINERHKGWTREECIAAAIEDNSNHLLGSIRSVRA
jgi:hypothetical protein